MGTSVGGGGCCDYVWGATPVGVVRPHGYYRGTMWVLDPPGGYPGKTRFFRETLGESGRVGPRIVFLGIRQRFVQGPSDGAEPHA